MADRNRKDFVDPATAGAIGIFAVKAIAQGILAWIAGRVFAKCWVWVKQLWQRREDDSTEEVLAKEPGEKT